MSTIETINSGDLELYVYGVLNESETNQIAVLSKTDSAVKSEIISIENSILQLSSSFSPNISSEVYEKIKIQLGLKASNVITMKPKSNIFQYLGWAASIALLVGIGYMYNKQIITENEVVTIEKEKVKLNEAVTTYEDKIKDAKAALAIIRDAKNSVISLAGQTISPTSSAKIYWNKKTSIVYVDASGLPEPPKGMVYQVWSLKLSPTLTPTSIGLLEDFNANNEKLFAVNGTSDADAFGITLEPAGGSKNPTMKQLYTLGKV